MMGKHTLAIFGKCPMPLTTVLAPPPPPVT